MIIYILLAQQFQLRRYDKKQLRNKNTVQINEKFTCFWKCQILSLSLHHFSAFWRVFTFARMAESVDALVSNTSGAIRAGSIPAPGTF